MEGLYYPSSENKGADQLRGYREADLRLCFRICKTLVFSRSGSFVFYCCSSCQTTFSGNNFDFGTSTSIEVRRPVSEYHNTLKDCEERNARKYHNQTNCQEVLLTKVLQGSITIKKECM